MTRAERSAARAEAAERALEVPQGGDGRLLIADPHRAANQGVAIGARQLAAELAGNCAGVAAEDEALRGLLDRCTPGARYAVHAASEAVFG